MTNRDNSSEMETFGEIMKEAVKQANEDADNNDEPELNWEEGTPNAAK